LTQRFQEASHGWRNIKAVSDEAAADLIRADRIDILIDLALHTGGHRLAVSARKPAPVQAAWAGYPGSTGLEAVDYRFTDPYLDPPGSDEYSSEEPIRLPDTFWCYDPVTDLPPVNPLPALTAGRITFGSLNNFCKVNERVIALWSRVLSAVPGSRLLLLSKDGPHRARTLELFQRCGVEPSRIEWFTTAARSLYLAAYHRIDLGLDTFPYNGHTTSLESFLMGVPVVTLIGPTRVGRGGLSQATNLGLPELIAYTPEQYVEIAVELAADLSRLSRLRATLRYRMHSSPLMDAPRFTRNMEAAFRTIWRRWCSS
jgi:predicted O-linked N-acetylglucosamine transferase (SPINDLY family)